MKKFLSKFTQEDGAVAIIVAVAMVVLLSFTALATDVGILYYKKSNLQTAVDSAALAAVSDLPNTAKATETALSYIEKNGFSSDDVVIEFSNNNKKIRITDSQSTPTFFANIANVSSMNFKAVAAAEMSSGQVSGVFDYLLFSGDENATLSMGAVFNIHGSVHSNGNFWASPSYGYIAGAAESNKNFFYNKWTTYIGEIIEDAPIIPMPSFDDAISQVMPTTFDHVYSAAEINAKWSKVNFYGNTKIIGNTTIGNTCAVYGNLVVEGNLTIKGGAPVCVLNGGLIYATGNIKFSNDFQGDGCIFAGGNISFSGGNNQITQNSPIALYSANGSIVFRTSSTNVHGLVYAPNGDCRIVGNNTTFHGNVIGNTISGIPANLVMHSSNIELPFDLSTKSARLVE